MYTVRYTQANVGSAYRPIFFQSDSVEDCVQVALNLHRASNVPHVVSVHHESDEPKIFREVLFLSLDPPSDLPFPEVEEVPDSPAYGKF